ncbi:MAG: TonB-dependent receptor [Bacteroidales bacterium]|nr:TonB-dependent receptor [Bacteroidales bacterium]
MYILILSTILYFTHLKSQEYLEGIVYEKEYIKGKTTFTPLPGASVYWLNTNIGTTTDERGKFKIKFTELSDRLVVSHVGYVSDTLRIVKGKQKVNVTLEKGEKLKEVEVISKQKGETIDKLNPIKTEVISISGLQRLPCCNLSESFENSGTVDVVYSDALTGAKQIQMLGLTGIHTELLGENIPLLNTLAYTHGLTYFPGTWLQSIQVSKGTGSVVNGFQSITGSINCDFKKPHLSPPLFLNAYINSDGRSELNLDLAKNFSNIVGSSILIHSESQFLRNDHNNDGFIDQPLSRQINIYNRWNIEKSDKYCIQYGFKFLYDNKTGGQTNFNIKTDKFTTNSYGISIINKKFDFIAKHGFFLKNNRSIGIQTFYSYHELPSFYGLNKYNSNNNFLYANLIYRSELFKCNNIEFGLSSYYDIISEKIKLPNIDTTRNIKYFTPGAFIQYSFNYEKILSVIGGIRADNFNNSEFIFTPRLHIKTELHENLTIRASAGKGFHITNIFSENLSYFATSRKWRIENIYPIDKAYTFGGSIYYKLKNILKHSIDLSFDFYRTQFISQVIIDNFTDPHLIHIYNLRGKSFSNSYQLNINTLLTENIEITLIGRYNNVKTTYNTTLTQKILAPPFKGLFIVSANTNNHKFQFDFTTKYTSKTKLPPISCHIEKHDIPPFSKEFFIMFFQVTYKAKTLDIYCGVENLLNFKQDKPIISYQDPFSEFFDSSIIWGPITGRMFYIGIRYNLKRQ